MACVLIILAIPPRPCLAGDSDEYSPSYGEMMDWSRTDYYVRTAALLPTIEWCLQGALGVPSDMPQAELKRFYRKLSLQLYDGLCTALLLNSALQSPRQEPREP